MIETRKSEIRYTTSDPKRMLGKYTTRKIFKTWVETAVDDKGNVVNIERNQLLFKVYSKLPSLLRFPKKGNGLNKQIFWSHIAQ